jgi:hypothetical protein
MALAGLLSTAENQRKLDSLVATEEFKALESNRRFERVWSILANSDKHLEPPDYWSDARGRRIVRIERSLSRMRLTFDEKLEPTLALMCAKIWAGYSKSLEIGPRRLNPSDSAATSSCQSSRQRHSSLRAGHL